MNRSEQEQAQRQNQAGDAARRPRRVFLLPPPALPVPAVRGGAVETLITHLIEENERQGRMQLHCASLPDPEAAAAAAGWRNTQMHWIAPSGRLARRLYGPARGMAFRLGRGDTWPQNPWYRAAADEIRAAAPDVLVAEGGSLAEIASIRGRAGLMREQCLAHLHMQTPCTPPLAECFGGVIGISEFVLDRWQPEVSQPGLASAAGRGGEPLKAAGPLPRKPFEALPHTRPGPDKTLAADTPWQPEGLPCAKHLVYNCVDLARFCPAPPPGEDPAALRAQYGFGPDDFVVLFCGRICPEKGIHKLVEAMAQLPAAFKLLVVGSPFFAAEGSSPFFARLRETAAPLEAAGRIRFTGFVHNSRLPGCYRAADAACLPALWDEPAGITAIEAMACGCPVIATDAGGMPEQLAGSGAVLLTRDERIADDGTRAARPGVPPLAGQIAEALLALAADPARRAAMAEAGAARARAFSRAAYYEGFCRAVGAV